MAPPRQKSGFVNPRFPLTENYLRDNKYFPAHNALGTVLNGTEVQFAGQRNDAHRICEPERPRGCAPEGKAWHRLPAIRVRAEVPALRK
jgi:hypothetical protein